MKVGVIGTGNIGGALTQARQGGDMTPCRELQRA
jgi:predicted dinucleotide-binding enzyme